MLFRLDLNVEVVVGDAECLAVERKTIHHRGTEDTENAKNPPNRFHFAGFVAELHFVSNFILHPLHLACWDATRARRCRTISYSTTAAATETFSDGTFPSIGIETRKSHFRFTRSCRPLPSPPRTRAQSMLKSRAS